MFTANFMHDCPTLHLELLSLPQFLNSHIFLFQTRLDALNQILALLNGDAGDKAKDVTIQQVSSQTVAPFSSISLLTSVHLQFLMGTFGLGTMEPVTGENSVATQLHNYTVSLLLSFFFLIHVFKSVCLACTDSLAIPACFCDLELLVYQNNWGKSGLRSKKLKIYLVGIKKLF